MSINTSRLSAGDFELSGPALLRKAFYPRQRLTITELSAIIGLSRDRLYKRIVAGKLNLNVQKNECGLPFVLLEDVIQYHSDFVLMVDPQHPCPGGPAHFSQKLNDTPGCSVV